MPFHPTLEEHAPHANVKEYQEFPEWMVALARGAVAVVPTVAFQGCHLIAKPGDTPTTGLSGASSSRIPKRGITGRRTYKCAVVASQGRCQDCRTP